MSAVNEMERALVAFVCAGGALQQAVRAERKCELDKPVCKAAAIQRLVGTTDPATQRPHSASSAEKIVEAEPLYHAFKESYTDAVVNRMAAECAYDVARFRADFAVGIAKRAHEEIGAAA